MCYSLTGCNEHGARFCCFAAETRDFASPKYSTSGSLNLSWKVEVELFFFQIVAMSLSFPVLFA